METYKNKGKNKRRKPFCSLYTTYSETERIHSRSVFRKKRVEKVKQNIFKEFRQLRTQK